MIMLCWIFLFLGGCTNNFTTNIKNHNCNDLKFIYQTIKENHPGIFNEEDPEFLENMEKAYSQAVKEFELNQTQALNNFVQSFNDPHLKIYFKKNEKALKIICKKESKFTISEISQNILWICLPIFDLSGKFAEKNFFAFVKKIENLKDKYKYKYIVFDLRGNQGGNSYYASLIVDALYGKNYANYKRKQLWQNIEIYYRVSLENLNHISFFAKFDFGLKEVVRQMKKAIKKNIAVNLIKQKFSFKIKTNKKFESKKIDFKIIVIIDDKNVSAALDFIDELKMMSEDVILIGKRTMYDTIYMEVRECSLPSGNGSFIFPIKFYRNKVKKNKNRQYLPDIFFEKIDDANLLKHFVLNLLN